MPYRMFERWRQENFFKYLIEEYALDALVEYATEPDDPAREVPNPKWNVLDGQLRQARSALKILHAEYGQKALLNLASRRPSMHGFKIAQVGSEDHRGCEALHNTTDSPGNRSPPITCGAGRLGSGGQTRRRAYASHKPAENGRLPNGKRPLPTGHAALQARRG